MRMCAHWSRQLMIAGECTADGQVEGYGEEA